MSGGSEIQKGQPRLCVRLGGEQRASKYRRAAVPAEGLRAFTAVLFLCVEGASSAATASWGSHQHAVYLVQNLV